MYRAEPKAQVPFQQYFSVYVQVEGRCVIFNVHVINSHLCGCLLSVLSLFLFRFHPICRVLCVCVCIQTFPKSSIIELMAEQLLDRIHTIEAR